MLKPSQLFEQVSIMSLSFFIHFYGEAKHGAALCGDAEARLRNLRTELGTKCSIILHSPLAVSGNDPLPVAQDERMLLCQLFLPDDRMPANVASEIAAGADAFLKKPFSHQDVRDQLERLKMTLTRA